MVLAVGYMGYYTPKERRTEQLNVRISKKMEEELKDLARLWTHIERVLNKDPEATVSVADVVLRLLQLGMEGAWNEVGIRPTTPEQWAEVEKRAEKVFGSPQQK